MNKTLTITLVLLFVGGVAMANTITDRLNIQDSGIRVGNAALNNTSWAGLCDETTGSYFALSQFELTGNEATVVTATLDLLLRDWNKTATTTIEVYLLAQADENWVDGEATGLVKSTAAGAWAGGSRPYLGGENAMASAVWTPPSAGGRGAFVMDVSNVVQQMLNEGRTNGTFYITSPDSASWIVGASMGQKETMWDRPGGAPYNYYDYQRLIVETTPEPATMGLLLIGGLGVLARRRRR